MECGNKAKSLDELKNLQLTVPKYVATDKEFFQAFLKECDAYEDAQMVVVKSAWIKDLFAEISDKICIGHLSEACMKTIDKMTAGLSFPVSVRSSASVEDAKNTSCAGLFYTALNVEKEQLIEEVKKVIASLYSYKCILAIEKQNFHPDHYYMGVIIQEMVLSEWSGVAFSEDPVSGEKASILIEAVEGLGEKLVSGMTKAIQFHVNKITKVPDDKTEVPQCLVKELVEKVCQLEEYYGYGVDVEWAISRGKLYLLQCRPIVHPCTDSKLDNYVWFPMRNLGVNFGLLAGLKKRYERWHKKERFYDFTYTNKIQTNQWNLLAFNRHSLDNIDFDMLLKSYESPYITYHLSDKYVASCEKTKLKDIVQDYVQVRGEGQYCVSIRESIPNTISAISYVNTDNHIQIEVVFGKMGVLNNGIVAPSLYMADEENRIILKNERMQNEYIFNREKVEVQKTDKKKVAILEEDLLKDIAEKTREFEMRFGTCSVEWWIWNSRAYAADISLLNNVVDTKAGRVISTGYVKGILREFPTLDRKTMDNLNMFSAISVSDTEFDVNQVDAFKELSLVIEKWKKDGPVILYSDLPYIYLTPFVKMVDAFVFKDASSLCHLSLIIREANIPAISLLGKNISDYKNRRISLNAFEGVVEME